LQKILIKSFIENLLDFFFPLCYKKDLEEIFKEQKSIYNECCWRVVYVNDSISSIKIKSEEKMKTKKFGKRLGLNKKTIANLSDGQLGIVKGGMPTLNTNVTVCTCIIQTPCTCETIIPYPCVYTEKPCVMTEDIC
jgi:hypothetical protein